MKLLVHIFTLILVFAVSFNFAEASGNYKSSKHPSSKHDSKEKVELKKNYGGKVTLKQTLPLDLALMSFEKGQKSTMLVEAKVDKVCKQKGCWMVLSDGEHNIRVTFKDYGFFVSEKLIGKSVKAQGVFVRKTMTVDDQKHYLKDEGASQKKIAEVKKDKSVISFIAEAVEVNI